MRKEGGPPNAKGLMACLFRGKVHPARNQMKTAELN